MNSQTSTMEPSLSYRPKSNSAFATLGIGFTISICTASKRLPNHFLGNYPQVNWQQFAHAIPEDIYPAKPSLISAAMLDFIRSR